MMEEKMEGANYPGLKNAIFLCLLLCGIQIAAVLVFGIIVGLLRIGTDSLIYGIGMIFMNLLSFGLVIFLGYKKTHKKFNEVFMFNNVSVKYWAPIIVFMLGFVIVSSELDNLLHFILPMPSFFQDLFESLLVNKYIIVSILLVGILPAFVEEMLFRGVIFNGFRENYSRRKTIILSSLLFGIIHLFNNMVSVLAMKLRDAIPIKGFNTAFSEQTFQPVWFDIVGIILTAAGIVLFLNNIKNAKNGA
jgi:uncharacterized protein